MTSSNPFAKRLEERQSGVVSSEEESVPNEDMFAKRAKEREGEGFLDAAIRWAYQIPSGLAKRVTYPLDMLNMMAVGSAMDPEGIEELERAHERLGIPFDLEDYKNAVINQSQNFPTQSNIERMIEDKTGLPLQAKTKGQKLLNLASTAAGFKPGNITSKAQAGVVAPVVSETAGALGIPEPVSEFLGLAAAGGTPTVKRSKVEKTSGLTERGFESLKEEVEIGEKKFNQINKKVKEDFTKISDQIKKDSPIGETAKNIANDPAYKQQTQELLQEAQNIADSIKETVEPSLYKKELADIGKKSNKGFMPSEYDKSYNKFLKESIKEVPSNKVTAGQLVEQYRKNNAELSEYFEPGASKSMNRAKRDVILDKNHAIASLMEKKYPDSEFVKVFKEGNERWTKIKDIETLDSFVNDIFKDKINHKNANELFDDRNVQRIFKRSLGEKGYKDFETLTKDLLQSEKAYKMLKVAQKEGHDNLVRSALAFFFNPVVGTVKTSADVAKFTYKKFIEYSLDKPKMITTLKKGIKEIKAADFESATATFDLIQKELKDYESEQK